MLIPYILFDPSAKLRFLQYLKSYWNEGLQKLTQIDSINGNVYLEELGEKEMMSGPREGNVVLSFLESSSHSAS